MNICFYLSKRKRTQEIHALKKTGIKTSKKYIFNPFEHGSGCDIFQSKKVLFLNLYAKSIYYTCRFFNMYLKQICDLLR